jgi:hypothetical protein
MMNNRGLHPGTLVALFSAAGVGACAMSAVSSSAIGIMSAFPHVKSPF